MQEGRGMSAGKAGLGKKWERWQQSTSEVGCSKFLSGYRLWESAVSTENLNAIIKPEVSLLSNMMHEQFKQG